MPKKKCATETEAPHVEPAEDLKPLIEALTTQLDEANSQRLRAVADYQNLKRRTDQEKMDLRRYATEELVRDLLPVLDNFERAIAAVETGGSKEALLDGVRAIDRQLRTVLENRQVRRIETVGDFDPSRHDAIIREDHPELPEGSISGEIEAGYSMADKVIRPAKVKVVAKQ